ncbi:MAG: hypothetical protein WAW41_06560 [Methylobacter sp.]
MPQAEPAIKGGRNQALAILDRLGDFADYQNTRDFPTPIVDHARESQLRNGHETT